MDTVITQHDVDINREIAEGLACEQRLERRASVNNFWKLLCGCGTIIGFLSGVILTLLLYMPQIKINTYRLDTIEKIYKDDSAYTKSLLLQNSTKLDNLTDALRNHEIGSGVVK